MKIKLIKSVSESTLQDNAQDFDITLFSYSEMSKKDFNLHRSSSLEKMIIGHEERENAPVYLALRNKITGEYCDTSSVLRLQESMYSERLEKSKADLKWQESAIESLNIELKKLREDKATIMKDTSTARAERLNLREEIKSLERKKRQEEREFESWKDDNPIFKFLYWLSQLIYD